MRIMTPPLSSLQRDIARTALLSAARTKKHTGIRPTHPLPRQKSAGIRVNGQTDMDDAIERARQAWPQTTHFSAFAADDFATNSGADPTYTEWACNDADGAPSCGDGCFSGCTDCGAFDVPPGLDISTVETPDQTESHQ